MWHRYVLRTLLGLYVLGLGFGMGVAVDRIRFDVVRQERLRELDETFRRLHERLMTLEHHALDTRTSAAMRGSRESR
jgi:hypothetical protein